MIKIENSENGFCVSLLEKKGKKMKKCELCNSVARMYCDSDQASLCWDCDARVHAANFLVAKHSRTLLCHVCQSSTPWTASGPRLAPVVSVCPRCDNTNSTSAFTGDRQSENDREGDDDDDDDQSDRDDNEDEDDDDEDNQVVPFASTPLPSPPPPVASSSSSSEDSSKRYSQRRFAAVPASTIGVLSNRGDKNDRISFCDVSVVNFCDSLSPQFL